MRGDEREPHSLRLHVLASGSRGNATIVQDAATGRGVLVDCGICKREFFARCEEVGFPVDMLEAIVVTHEHSDHTKGLGVVLRGLRKQGIDVPLYAASELRRASTDIATLERDHDVRTMRIGETFEAAGIAIDSFSTSHDAASSCGFRFESSSSDTVGFMTDTGIVTGEAHEALAGVRLLALESNHDVRLLETGPYPYPVKRRIASDRGHLSNEQAASELESLLDDALEHVVAMHVSENNNTYRLPLESLRSVVERAGHAARVSVAYQARPISVI